MKKSLLTMSGIALCAALSAQLSLSTEVVQVHTETTADGVDLAGYTTYRVYVNFNHPDDFLSAWGGVISEPVQLVCEGDVFQSPLGGALGTNQNPAFFDAFPSVAFDSYLTIGLTQGGVPNTFLQSVSDAAQPFLNHFQSDGSFIINTITGGGLFTLNGNDNGIAGDDLKVLIMQLTTNGHFSLTTNIDFFPEGVSANADKELNLSTSSDDDDVFGCMDEAATNYNPDATVQDFSCVFPCDLSVEYVVTNPCPSQNNGAVTVQINGAQLGAKMSWQNGPFQYIYTKTSLSAITYSVEIEDGVGCTLSSSVSLAALSGSASVTSLGCYDDNDAVVSGTFMGGNEPIVYGLTMGDYDNDQPLFDGLAPGSYSIFAQDANGCLFTTNSVDVVNPPAIELSGASASNSVCAGVDNGSVSVTASGGTGALTFGIEGTDITSPNGMFNNLAAGAYTILVTDANGCAAATAELTVEDDGGFGFESIEVTDASCFGATDGSISVEADNSAIQPVTYGLSIDDINSAEGDFGMLVAGSYTVYAQDQQGCTAVIEGVVIDQPEEIVAETSVIDASCSGSENGSVEIVAEGGAGDFGFELNGDSNDTGIFADLAAGSYSISVTDGTGCSVNIEVDINEPEPITIALTSTNADCNGGDEGSVTVVADGGNGDFSYSINGGDATTESEFSGLGAGTYNVIVTDALGCEASDDVTVSEPTAIEVSGTTQEDSGNGDGSITLSVSGGTPGYSYSWSGPGNFSASTQNISGLEAGSYTVTVTDDNGCSVTVPFDVTVGIFELTGGVSISLYPNPSQGQFFLNIDGLNGQRTFWQVTDAKGRIVVGKESFNNAGAVREIVDLTNQADGMYFLQVGINGETMNLRMVKF